MEINNFFLIIASIICIIIITKILKVSLKKIIKLVINSILGGALIFTINQMHSILGIHIGLNAITSVFVGLFGIPGVILLILLKIF